MINERRGKITIQTALACFPVSVALAAVVYLTWNMGSTLRYSGKVPVAERIPMILNVNAVAAVALTVICYILLLAAIKFGRQVLEFAGKYRYMIGGVLFVFCILFEISGSSISMYGDYLGIDVNSRGLLFGTGRGIRMDEWATNTPMALSQYANDFGYFSDIIRGTATDAFIVYGQPVCDLAVIFRPFHWGYLFLEPAKGLSFFWCGRLIALFLVSFEMGMLITKKNRFWSFLYSMLLCFSPIVQWWFAINGLVEILVFGQLFILMVFHFLITDKWYVKLAASVVAAICGGGYVLVFYPAWQVPLGYMFLGLFIWIILEYRKKWKPRWKKDGTCIAVFFLILAGGLLYIFLKSQDAILAVLNTVYPGSRVEIGGGCLLQPLQYGGNIFFSLISDNLPGILCEMTEFFDLSPLGLLAALWVIFGEKCRDKFLVIMTVICIGLWFYAAVPIPELIARITLLSFSQAGRTAQVIGFANLLLLVRSVTLMKKSVGRLWSLLVAVILTGGLLVVNHKVYGAYLPVYMLAAVGITLFAGAYLVLRWRAPYAKLLLGLFAYGVLFYSGGLANPVQKGLDVVYETDLMGEIQKITEDDPEGKWICDMVGYPMNNYTIMGGAPTIDSINVYPDLKRWGIFDQDGSQEDIYNRYAHIDVEIVDSGTSFQPGAMADSFKVSIDKYDLDKLEISYILTNRELEGFSDDGVTFEQVAEGNGYKIYHYEKEREKTNG